MKSRTKKWAHYRETIKKLPAEKFPKRKDYTEVASISDLAEMNVSAKASNALSGNVRNTKATPYAVYQRRRSNMLIFKLVVTFLVVAGLVCAWFFWVMR